MEKHGWRVVREDNERFYLLRPGQTSSVTSAVVFKDKRIFYPHTTSTSFQNKGYNPFAVYTHLECKGDWKKACKQLSDVYGNVNTDGWFWYKTEKGHVIISRYKFQEWLHDNYVQLYFHNKNSGAYRLVHTDNKRIKEVHAEDIKKYVKQELVKHNHIDVMEAVMKSTNSYFVPSFFEYIDKADVKIMHDKQDKCYFPFNNQIVVITKDNISSINYGDIDEYIWESQIIDKDIKINTEFDPLSSVFFKFLCKISADDPKRVQYAMTLIGYILHSFKDPSKPYAPILAEETDDESKGGGTGKGLFFQAIAKLIPVVIIDGNTL